MNSLWCFVLLSIALVEGKGMLYKVPQEYAPGLLKAAATCSDPTGTQADAVKKIIAGNLEDSESFKKFLYCFSVESGYVDARGRFILDEMVKLVGDHKDKSKFIDALRLCNNIESINDLETAYKIATCFRDTSPIYFTL